MTLLHPPATEPNHRPATPVVPGHSLRQGWGRFCQCSRTDGIYRLADPESHFNHTADAENLSYDIGNNAMLAIHGADGELKAVTAYRDTYLTLTAEWPGVWTAKDNSTCGPYSFAVETGGRKHDLATVDWDLRTGLLDNLVPVTEYSGPQGEFIVRLVTFAPVSADGAERVRAIVHGLELENRSATALAATVHLPRSVNRQPFDRWAQSDSFAHFDIWLGDAASHACSVAVTLAPGAAVWVPAVIAPAGEGAADIVNARGTLAWLDQTQAYYRGLLGRLSTPDHPFLAEFHERMFMQALHSIAQSGSGRIAGSNWGSVPPTRMIWTKDFFYSALPLLAADPEFAGKIVAWFDRYGIRPAGTTDRADRNSDGGAGGATHSVSLSVAAPLLASLIHRQTGETALFRRHPQWRARWGRIFDELAASRIDPGIWLFSSRYISDGPIAGDYHTGSNLAVWRALVGYARLLEDVWGEPETARTYREMAAGVKEALLARTVVDGPLGRQFIEAVNRDGSVPAMESDGEESETTLMPYYGFLDDDDPLYLNTMRFAVSVHNLAYRPQFRAISWAVGVPSTAPGYNKGLCAWDDEDRLFGEHGALTEMRRLADGDGSLWWWSYGYGDKTVPYGKPVRAVDGIGKSAWAAGVFGTVFVHRFAGIAYDAPSATLRFAPLPAMGDMAWTDLAMGRHRFSLACTFRPDAVSITVENHNDHAVALRTDLPLFIGGTTVDLGGKPLPPADWQCQMGKRKMTITLAIPRDKRIRISAQAEKK